MIGGRGSLRILSTIAAFEIATLLMLSTGAGVMLKSFWKMRHQNLGFAPDHLIAATLTLPGARYRGCTRSSRFSINCWSGRKIFRASKRRRSRAAGEIPPGTWHATNVFYVEGRSESPWRVIGRSPDFNLRAPSIFSILRNSAVERQAVRYV